MKNPLYKLSVLSLTAAAGFAVACSSDQQSSGAGDGAPVSDQIAASNETVSLKVSGMV